MWTRYINTTCAMIGAAAAVAIPLVLNFDAEQNRQNDNLIARNSSTLQLMDDLDQRISAVIGKKIELDQKNNPPEELLFHSTYIDDPLNRDVQLQVYRLLNIYDFVCLGAREGLFSEHIIEQMRGDALRQTWQDYSAYIKDHRNRAPANAHAWENCDSWVLERTTSY